MCQQQLGFPQLGTPTSSLAAGPFGNNIIFLLTHFLAVPRQLYSFSLVLDSLLNISPKGLSWNYVIAYQEFYPFRNYCHEEITFSLACKFPQTFQRSRVMDPPWAKNISCNKKNGTRECGISNHFHYWKSCHKQVLPQKCKNALGFINWCRRGIRQSSPFTSLFKNGWKLKFTKRWSSTLLFIGYIVCLSVCYHYLHDWPLLKTLPLHWTILETCDIWDMIRIMRRRNLTIAMAFEALITLLTIEKNNLNIHLWPLNKEWRGQHSLILRCFLQKSNTVWFTLLQCCLHSVSPSDANEKGIGKEQRTEVTNHAMFYVTPEMSQRFFRNHCYLLLGGWLGRDGPWWWMIHHGSWAQQKCTLLQGT